MITFARHTPLFQFSQIKNNEKSLGLQTSHLNTWTAHMTSFLVTSQGFTENE